MKKNWIQRFIDGVTVTTSGEHYGTIIYYLWPECISTFVLYALPTLLDTWFISAASSTIEFGIFGITGAITHFIFKISEATSTGTTVLCGQHNGSGNYKAVGESLVSAFWSTMVFGAIISGFLYFGAETIYYIYNVPVSQMGTSVPYLQLRSISILFTFLYFPLIGFMRGVKNTRTPMLLFVSSSLLFVFLDYVFIFGKFGCPELKLYGSALAATIQAFFILVGAFVYIYFSENKKLYSISFLKNFNFDMVKTLVQLSWPMMIDKATLAAAAMWLAYMVSPLGAAVKASYTAIRDLQRVAIMPGVACAQVVTFLVSNRMGKHDWAGIKNTVKKVLVIANVIVLSILLILSIWPTYFISFFDKSGSYTYYAAISLPIISLFVILDILQVVIAGALRGAAEVKIVMMGRLIAIFFFLFQSHMLLCFCQ